LGKPASLYATTGFLASKSTLGNTPNLNKRFPNQGNPTGATRFCKASASCSKILNDKKYIISTVNSGHPLFFRVSACKLLKTPEGKKYIQYSERFQGNSGFQGKHKVAQKS